jgi:hypothetical protein
MNPSSPSLQTRRKEFTQKLDHPYRPQQRPRRPWVQAATSALIGFGLMGMILGVWTPLPGYAVSGGGLDYAGIDISGQDFANGNYKGKDFTQGMYYVWPMGILNLPDKNHLTDFLLATNVWLAFYFFCSNSTKSSPRLPNFPTVIYKDVAFTRHSK